MSEEPNTARSQGGSIPRRGIRRLAARLIVPGRWSGTFGVATIAATTVVSGFLLSFDHVDALGGRASLCFTAIVLAVAGLALYHLMHFSRRLQRQSPSTAFHACNRGLAFCCVAFSITAGIILVGLLWTNYFPHVSGTARTNPETLAALLGRKWDIARSTLFPGSVAHDAARLLYLSSILAALGASLYCLKAISRFAPYIDDDAPQPQGAPAPAGAPPAPAPAATKPLGASIDTFDIRLFWSGYWYRLAQAEVYTVAAFLIVWGLGAPPPSTIEVDRPPPFDMYWWLPLAALFIGLFVKAAERVVAGLAERAVAVVNAMLPPK